MPRTSKTDIREQPQPQQQYLVHILYHYQGVSSLEENLRPHLAVV